MQLEIDRAELLHAARLGQRFCGSPKTNAVLAHVLLRVEEDLLEIAATDLTRSLRYRLNPEKASRMVPGSVLVSGDRLVGILQASSEKMVSLAGVDGRVDVRLGKGEFSIFSEDPGNFPSMPSFPERVDVVAGGRALVEMGQKCAVATTSLEERFSFDAICLIVTAGEIQGVSTDGRRLVSVIRGVENKSDFEGRKLIAPDLLAQVGKLGPTDDPVEMAFGQRHVFLRTGRAEIAVIDREGKFPPIEKVFNKEPSFNIEIERVALQEALQQVEYVLDDKENTVVLTLEGELLQVRGESSQGGKGHVEVSLGSSPPEKYEVEFNPGLLIEFLKVMEDEKIQLGFRGPAEQVLLKERDARVDYLVMPIRKEDPQEVPSEPSGAAV